MTFCWVDDWSMIVAWNAWLHRLLFSLAGGGARQFTSIKVKSPDGLVRHGGRSTARQRGKQTSVRQSRMLCCAVPLESGWITGPRRETAVLLPQPPGVNQRQALGDGQTDQMRRWRWSRLGKCHNCVRYSIERPRPPHCATNLCAQQQQTTGRIRIRKKAKRQILQLYFSLAPPLLILLLTLLDAAAPPIFHVDIVIRPNQLAYSYLPTA